MFRQSWTRLATLLVTFAVVTLALLVFIVPPRTQLAIGVDAAGTTRIEAVEPGSAAWRSGIRVGQDVIDVQGQPTTAGWESLLVGLDPSNVVTTDVQRERFRDLGMDLLPVLLLGGLALVCWPMAPRFVYVFAALTALMANARIGAVIDAPLNQALLLAGPIIGSLAVGESLPQRPASGVRYAGPLLVLLVLLLDASALAGGPADFRLVDLAGLTATLTLVSIGVGVGLIGPVRRAKAHRRALAQTGLLAFARALTDELLPGRLAARAHAAELERTRIAIELHNDILPRLSSLSRLATDPEAAADMAALETDVREIMNERRLYILDAMGLVAALEWLAEQIQARGQTEVVIDDQSAAEGRPPLTVEQAAYRVAQEAIGNAMKHGPPRHLTLRVDISARILRLVIGDDGPGFDQAATTAALRAGRLGLPEMQEVAESVGAQLALHSQPGAGTEVAFTWTA